MSITTALKARREQLRDREAGFTLIELLVVVIIIGILAAIAIPVYLGVQNSAKDSSTVNDLANAKVAINAAYSANNTWTPLSSASDNASATAVAGKGGFGSFGWTVPTDTNLSGPADDSTSAGGSATAWCLKQTSGSNNVFYVTQGSAPTKTKPTTGCL